MLPALLKVSIYIDFKINQDYIAKELCVMKDKPDNCCQGNCHLKKQLEKANQTTSKKLPKAVLAKIKVELFYSQEQQKIVVNQKYFQQHSEPVSFYISPGIKGIYHPPKIHI